MNNLSTHFFCLAIVCCCCAGCASHELTSLENVPPNEVIAIGKIRALHNGKDITEGCTVLFNAPATGVPKYSYTLDQTGYFFTRVPLGQVSINYVLHPDGITQHHFRPGQLSYYLNASKAVYYLGDITINWKGTGSAKNWAIATTFSVLGAGALGQGQIVAEVSSNVVPAQEAFRLKFPNNREVIPALLTVEP